VSKTKRQSVRAEWKTYAINELYCHTNSLSDGLFLYEICPRDLFPTGWTNTLATIL